MSNLFGKTITILQTAMDLRYMKHKLITSNIANAETPGYKAKDIRFEVELKKEVEQRKGSIVPVKTHPLHMGESGAVVSVTVIERGSATKGLDGNTVNIDEEIVRLSENATMYSMLAKLIKHKFSHLMTAIKEGGK